MKNLKTIITIIFISLILSACSDKNNSPQTITVALQSNTTTLNYSGTIQPIHVYTVDSPVDGTISQQFFDYGENVKAGQTLFQISSPQLLQDYQNALSDYLKTKKDYLNNQAQMQGNEQLKKLGLISANEYQSDKSNNFDLALAYSQATEKLQSILEKSSNNHLNLAELPINNLSAVTQALNQPFNNLKISAPNTGIALVPLKNPDSSTDNSSLGIGSSVKAGQSLLTIGDISGLMITVKVNEVDINQLKVGQKAIITGDAFPNLSLTGEVTHIDQQAVSSDTDSVPTFPIKIIIPHITTTERNIIHIGMSADVAIQITQPANIQLPLSAVFEKNNQAMVNIIEPKTGKIISVPVVTGPTTLDSVAIIHGLNPGDKVINNAN